MTENKIAKFIQTRRDEGWAHQDIADGLNSRGGTTKRGLPFNRAKVADFITRKLSTTLTDEPEKRTYKKKSVMVTLPVPEQTTSQRLVALIGRPEDVIRSLNQITGGF